MNFLKYYKTLKSHVRQELNETETGDNRGISTGFEKIDKTVGRIKKGHIWIIGGYSGTGKSFFVLNIVNNILSSEDAPKMVMFSTEISSTEYTLRHILLRLGVFRTSIENNFQQYKSQIEKVESEYFIERMLNPESYVIRGKSKSYEEIEKYLESNETPDIIFIDYIQDLTIKGKIKEEDTMPELSAALSKLAKKYDCAIVVVSQVNNYAVNTDFTKTRLSPFSFGKQLNQAADVTLLLTRRKKESELCSILEVEVMKSRHGTYGNIPLQIAAGFKLDSIHKSDAKELISKFLEKTNE